MLSVSILDGPAFCAGTLHAPARVHLLCAGLAWPALLLGGEGHHTHFLPPNSIHHCATGLAACGLLLASCSKAVPEQQDGSNGWQICSFTGWG